MICSKEECTGCYACYNICPKNAIKMEEDCYGNIYPIVDKNKCINCNLCQKVCPQINAKTKFNIPTKAIALYSTDSNIRKNSTSGGAATVFCKKIIEEGGVVYGASNLFNNESFQFIRIDNILDLYKIQGSKYLHCYVKDSFKKLKEDLVDGKKVLFIGTPCQVAGLKSFLMKEYNNLITIDIICHGVATQKLLFEDLKKYRISKNDFEIITFRDENGYNMRIFKDYNDFCNKKYIKSIYANQDSYFKNFLRGNIFRDNCFSCKYAQKGRVSDITIGDFWGLDKSCEIYDDENKGISAVIPITKAGNKLINSILNDVIFEERSYEEVSKYNKQLNYPIKKNEKFNIYKELYPKYGFDKTMKKMNFSMDTIKYGYIYSILKKIKSLKK